MTLDDVMAQDRQSLLAEYVFKEGAAGAHLPPYCAVPDLQVVKWTPSFLRGRHPVDLTELPGKKGGQAFVQSCSSLNYKFLWVHVDNEYYRDDYETFLRKHHGMALTKLPGTYHVDHLFNRARARTMALTFIRAVLLPQTINVSHGAGYEKSRTRGGIGRPGRERGIDEIVLMKLCGVSTPRKGMPLTADMMGHVSRIAVQFGIPIAEVERNIRELMDVASFESGV